MSFRPIDFQVSVTRSTEIPRVNNNNMNRADEQQQLFSQQLGKQVEIETSQVLQSTKSEFNKVDRDGKNNQGNKKEKKKDEKKKDEALTKKKSASSTSMYDISI